MKFQTVQQILRERNLSFSDDPIKPIGSDEDSPISDGDRQEATQEQQVQPRPLRRSDRVLVPLIKYS